jgi:hypothetical protein
MEVKISDYALTDLHDVMRTLTSVATAAWIAPGTFILVLILRLFLEF